MKTYRVVDLPIVEGKHARAVRTGAFRKPMKGEFYLSGATPMVYRAPNDLSTEFNIMKLILPKLESRYV